MTKKLLHISRMAIRWGDMDAFGHVNNTNYFRYMEQARIDCFERLGFLPDITGDAPVIVNAHCSFNKQLKYPGEIEIRTYGGKTGRSSFETINEIRRVDDPDTLYAEGGAKVVWINIPDEKSVPLPDWLRKILD